MFHYLRVFLSVFVLLLWYFSVESNAEDSCFSVDGISYYDQYLCDPSKDMPLTPGWCHVGNPLSGNPMLLTDITFEDNSDIAELQDGSKCQNGVCMHATAIQTIENDQNSTQSYLLIGTVQGNVFFSRFFNQGKDDALVLQPFANETSYHDSTDKSIAKISCDSSNQKGWCMFMTGNDVTTAFFDYSTDDIQWCRWGFLFIDEIMPPNKIPVEIYTINAGYFILWAVLVSEDGDPTQQELILWASGLDCFSVPETDIYSIPFSFNDATDRFPDVDLSQIKFGLIPQGSALNPNSNSLLNHATRQGQRTLLSFTNSKYVHVACAEHNLLNKNTRWEFDGNVETSFSAMYVAPEGEIINDAQLIGEYLRRFDSVSNETSLGSCPALSTATNDPMWLLVTVTNETGSFLKIIEMAELTNFEWWNTNMTDPVFINNPGNRSSETVEMCSNINEQYAFQHPITGEISCRDRRIYEKVLPSPAVNLEVSYRNAPWDVYEKLWIPPNEEELIALFCEELLEDHDWVTDELMASCLVDVASSFNDTCVLSELLQNEEASHSLREHMIHTVFVACEDGTVEIFGIQEDVSCEPNSAYNEDPAYLPNTLTVDYFQTVVNIGNLTSMYVSPNSHHLYMTISRPQWQEESFARFIEICDTLAVDPENEFLQAYVADCTENPPSKLDLNFYGMFASLCPPGKFCPSTLQEDVLSIEDGYYASRSMDRSLCPEGHWCPNGIMVPCPKGFICPNVGMDRPIQCTHAPTFDESCYEEGLLASFDCPDGFSCVAPYFRPIPAAAGSFFVKDAPRADPLECAQGNWCPLGSVASASDNYTQFAEMSCPPATYCSSPDVLLPEVCECGYDTCNFCPAGSSVQTLCTAGFYCPSPMEIYACDERMYCPEGTTLQAPCPAGFYCSVPSAAIECPVDHYCVEGSLSPTPCLPLSDCPAGSDNQAASFLGAVILIAFMGLLLIAWQVYRYYRERKRFFQSKDHELRDVAADLLQSTTNISEGNTAGLTGKKQKEYTVDISFNNLGLVVHGSNKVVLKGVTGVLPHGTVTAIMGPSGAGKTTFLTTLAGKAYYGEMTGSIELNYRPGRLEDIRRIMGFVPQEDVMHRELTVKENLQFSAALRLPSSVSRQERNELVDEVLITLNLHAIRHSMIGDEKTRGISGGQRKRVNIGMELVADPTILFLDEPTSGLDSTSSMEVMQSLRDIAALGLTCAAVIHQPRYEIYKALHRVLLLGPGGRTVYLGPTEKTLDYFESMNVKMPERGNPADFFMDVISGNVNKVASADADEFTALEPLTEDELFARWEEVCEYSPATVDVVTDGAKTDDIELEDLKAAETKTEDAEEDINTEAYKQKQKSQTVIGRSSPNFFFQLQFVTFRCFIQQTRDLQGYLLDNVLIYVAGLALGLVFYNAQFIGPPAPEVIALCAPSLQELCALPIDDPLISLASLSILAFSLVGVMAALRVFSADRVVYFREASTGTSKFAYFLGKNLSQLPSIALAPAVYLLVITTLTGLRASFTQLYVIFLASQFAVTGLGYLISLTFPSSLTTLAGVVLVLASQLFSGTRPTLPALDDMFFPMWFIPYLSFIRWGQEAFYLIEIKEYEAIYDTDTAMTLFGYDHQHFEDCIYVVFLFGLIFRIMAFVAMVFMDRHKQV